LDEGGQLIKIHWAFSKTVYFYIKINWRTFLAGNLITSLRLFIIVFSRRRILFN